MLCWGKSSRHNVSGIAIPTITLPISYTNSYSIVNSPITDPNTPGMYQDGAIYWDIRNVTLSSFEVDIWSNNGHWFCDFVYYITIGY